MIHWRVDLFRFILGVSVLLYNEAAFCPENKDTCTQDLTNSILNETYSKRILELKSIYEEKPTECRIGYDLCNEPPTSSLEKGDIVWPLTEIGSRRLMRCPYGYREEQVVSRDCLLSENSEARWTELNDDICPCSPFCRATIRLHDTLETISVFELDQCQKLLEQMKGLVDIRKEFPEHPILSFDIDRLIIVLDKWIDNCYVDCSGNVTRIILWTLADILLNVSWDNTKEYKRFIVRLQEFFPPYSSTVSEPERFFYNGLVLEALSEGFHNGSFHHEFDATNDNSITALLTINGNTSLMNVRRLRSFFLKRVNYLGHLDFSNDDLQTSGNVLEVPVEYETVSMESSHEIETATQTNYYELTHWTETLEKNYTESSVDRKTVETETENIYSQENVEMNTTQTHTENNYTDIQRNQKNWLTLNILGPIIFIKFDEISSNDNSMPEIEFMLRHPDYIYMLPGSVCANAVSQSKSDYKEASNESDDNGLNEWSTKGCSLVQILNDTVTCRCTGVQEYFAVFGEIGIRGMSNPGEIPRSDVSVLLGFPYVKELWLAGIILRAISIICLVITILSYALFRKSRKGTPTRILINLCVSLIILLVVLYVADFEATTKIGCRVLNILRYYLVFVSLLWNAVEAYNMYRMLVKVFSAETSHFVLIAGIFSWGVPALFVAIGIAVDFKAFDGTYLSCEFRCKLQSNTLVYGWILPMSVIIAHNLIMFSIVMSKLLMRKEPISHSLKGSDSNRSHGKRLIGACTMLVLLGIPWFFSAFGVIDTKEGGTFLKHVEGVFHVIFIVCMSLQGLFIFAFHCLRNRAIREHWRQVVRMMSTTTSTTISSTTMSELTKRESHSMKSSRFSNTLTPNAI